MKNTRDMRDEMQKFSHGKPAKESTRGQSEQETTSDGAVVWTPTSDKERILTAVINVGIIIMIVIATVVVITMIKRLFFGVDDDSVLRQAESSAYVEVIEETTSLSGADYKICPFSCFRLQR